MSDTLTHAESAAFDAVLAECPFALSRDAIVQYCRDVSRTIKPAEVDAALAKMTALGRIEIARVSSKGAAMYRLGLDSTNHPA